VIRGYAIADGRLLPVSDPLAAPETVTWFDLFEPTPEEEETVERAIGIDVPTLAEIREIEDSSRLYTEGSTIVMTATLPSKTESGDPVPAPVSFILAGRQLITVRYETPRVFSSFPHRAERLDLGCSDGITVMLALLEAIIERLADLLEGAASAIEGLSRAIFQRDAAGRSAERDYGEVLKGVGTQGAVLSHMLASLITLERLIAFLGAVGIGASPTKDTKARIKSLSRDTRFLAEHATFLSQKINFLLDATLGMISIQQNSIIKIFSVAAVIFLPPTLVASIYGMNFDVMPELHWLFGYPFALGLMVLSAVVSYLVFKTRGWL
jgi:magnesium transporter